MSEPRAVNQNAPYRILPRPFEPSGPKSWPHQPNGDAALLRTTYQSRSYRILGGRRTKNCARFRGRSWRSGAMQPRRPAAARCSAWLAAQLSPSQVKSEKWIGDVQLLICVIEVDD